MSTTTFGEYLKQLRLERRITLRTFAETINMDAANFSKVERGKQAPPRGAKLEPLRKALRLDTDSLEWREMERLASIDRGEIPHAILSDAELLDKLPALFRTLEGDPVDDATLDELVAALRRE